MKIKLMGLLKKIVRSPCAMRSERRKFVSASGPSTSPGSTGMTECPWVRELSGSEAFRTCGTERSLSLRQRKEVQTLPREGVLSSTGIETHLDNGRNRGKQGIFHKGRIIMNRLPSPGSDSTYISPP